MFWPIRMGETRDDRVEINRRWAYVGRVWCLGFLLQGMGHSWDHGFVMCLRQNNGGGVRYVDRGDNK